MAVAAPVEEGTVATAVVGAAAVVMAATQAEASTATKVVDMAARVPLTLVATMATVRLRLRRTHTARITGVTAAEVAADRVMATLAVVVITVGEVVADAGELCNRGHGSTCSY